MDSKKKKNLTIMDLEELDGGEEGAESEDEDYVPDANQIKQTDKEIA